MNPLAQKFRVAVYDEFLDAFAKLPRAQQKKVSHFMRKFRADPTSGAINYEKISTFRDPNMRTVRIDQQYRAVVLKPEQGNIYVLLWVDNHDEAMAWAEHKQVIIHPETGSLQVLVAEPVVEAPLAAAPAQSASKNAVVAVAAPLLFAQWNDADLVGLGVPEQALSEIRGIRSDAELDGLAARLPQEAYEALFFLSSGETIEAVRQTLAVEKPTTIDPTDFAAALDTAASQRRFTVVTDDQELEAILDAPLEKWRIFLHPSQRRIVTANFSGPARVLGGAGTGKTVVAMHRAKHLVTQIFTGEEDRVLFTTFTVNLAHDIKENLQKLVPPSAMRRIEVVHLDKWVTDFLRSQGYDYKIEYWDSKPLQGLWDDALGDTPERLDLRREFFREEWDFVVQPGGCTSYEAYRDAARVSRGVRLSRDQRKKIWPVFEEYRNRLEAKRIREPLDAMRDAVELLKKLKGRSRYRAVVVDESQDMSTIAFQVLRALVAEEPNDLFIVGDGHQRIYRRQVALTQAGVKITGRSKKLYVNYRTTDEIRRYAVALLHGTTVDDLDGGKDDNKKYKSLMHGAAPTILNCGSFAKEIAAIIDFIKADTSGANQTCLVTRRNKDLDQYEAALREKGIETYRVRRSEADDRNMPGLRLATMHRVKGLEFDRMVIARVNEGTVPLLKGDVESDDQGVREEAELRERALFYVACTRAKRALLITSGGTPSPWIAQV
jgi:superfamily I DNA/RNA helicase